MKTIYCCFTCPRDYDLLSVHAEHIRKTDEEAIIAYAVDKDDPIPDLPEQTISIKTCFQRNGNLNGREAVMGEILTMLQLVREFNVDRIVKIDTDTALLSDMWIRQADFVGFHSSNGYYATGCCYSISAKALEAMWQYVLVHNIGDNRYTLPEDQVMTMIAAIAGNVVKIIENDLAPYCIPYIGDNVVQHLNRGVQVVHCGQWQRLRGHDDDRLDIIARDMRMLMDSRID